MICIGWKCLKSFNREKKWALVCLNFIRNTYKQNMVLNNLQRLICHKTQTTKPTSFRSGVGDFCSLFLAKSNQLRLVGVSSSIELYIYIYIYIYIVIHRLTVSLYHSPSVRLDTLDAWSWDRNPPNFTLDLVSDRSANNVPNQQGNYKILSSSIRLFTLYIYNYVEKKGRKLYI